MLLVQFAAQLDILGMVGYIPSAARNVPAYCTLTLGVEMSIRNPTIAMTATPMLQYPRHMVRSANQPMKMVNTAAPTYGGTESSGA